MIFHSNYNRYHLNITISLSTLCLFGCTPVSNPYTFDYGTQNDSARYYFFKGWEEIMDNGRWTESEAAFRKAIELDPDWTLGKSLVGRITRNTEERIQILSEIEEVKDNLSKDEMLLLEVNILSLKAANKRDQGKKVSSDFNVNRRLKGKENFGEFSHKYPTDNYFKAEYIEFVHAIHGPQIALDTLKSIVSSEQRALNFYKYYEATLELELGVMNRAKIILEELRAAKDSVSHNTYALLEAKISMAEDSLLKAEDILQEIMKRDSNHLIAKSMLKQLTLTNHKDIE